MSYVHEWCMLRLPPVNTLRAFEAAARLNSTTAAGKELCVTQSAISHQIRNLETWLGTQLFERHGGHFRLSDVGASYWRVVSHALRLIERESLRIKDIKEEEPISISAPTLFASGWLVPRLYLFWEKYPGLMVNVLHVGPRVEPDFDRAEMAICYGPANNWPGCHTRKLHGHGLTPVASPSYVDEHGSLKALESFSQAVLLHVVDHSEWQEWFVAAGLNNVVVNEGPVFSTTNGALAAAMAGKGIALCPTGEIGADFVGDRLVEISDVQIRKDYGAYAVWPKGRALRSSAVTLKDWLIERFAASVS